MSRHTPGKWIVGEYGSVFSEPDQTGHRIEICIAPKPDSYSGAVGFDDWKANARLIAAAPEMLEALYRIANHLDGHSGPYVDIRIWALEAIAKIREVLK